jgi:hypothetical protein
MNKSYLYLASSALSLVLCTASCSSSDDTPTVPKLPNTSFVESSCVADSNSVTLGWNAVTGATSYTAELGTDTLFTSASVLSQTVNGLTCKFTGLPLSTRYYARAKANDEVDKTSSDWTLLKKTIATAPAFPDYGEVLAFPGAEGFGRHAIGGRKGTVYHVTNLDDSGPGSFRDAVSAPNRIIVFDVSGVIRISKQVACSNNLTIAAQTAPGDGVTIYGADVAFSGSDNIICRYLRIRMGLVCSADHDACGISHGHDMIFDHMSVTWGRDECFSINWYYKFPDKPKDITIQNSIIGQGLQPHSCGGLIQTTDSNGVTLFRNLYVDNKTRNPKVRGLNQYVNNVLYNWGNGGAYIMGDDVNRSTADIEDNYFIVGPTHNYDGTNLGAATPFSRYSEAFWAYFSNNKYDYNKDGKLNGRLLTKDDCTGHRTFNGVDSICHPTFMDKPDPLFPTIKEHMTPEDAYNWVVKNGGPTLPARDQVDTYIISELTSLGTKGNIINDEASLPTKGPGELKSGVKPQDTDNDGMPDAFEDKYGLDKNNPKDAMKIAKNGYTNIENYIFLIGK